MLNDLHHRGPDEDGFYSNEKLSLGMKRLSIIDLETGSQPIYNEDKSIVIVCNGQIYNYQILRNDLLKKGHIFYTNSDVEVLVHLYEQYSTDCLKFLKGMFSFALWDQRREELFIARDRFGIKPLYYYSKNGLFAFSSELKALLRIPGISKDLNFEALSLYFSLEYIPSPASIFKDIYKLKPAHYLIYKNGNIDIRRYWDLNFASYENRMSFPEARDRFNELLCDSIKEHLISDVPLGVFLSGGIDSSTLAALAKQSSIRPISTFSIGFEEPSFDESRYAHLVSKYLATDHHEYIFTTKDFIDNFRPITAFLDEPMADLSIFPTYILSKFSRQRIKVALSGEGADELFFGYPTYIAHRYANLYSRLPRSLRRIIQNMASGMPTSFEYFSLDFKLKRFLKGINEKDPLKRHLSWMGAFSSNDKNKIFSDNSFTSAIKNTDGADSFLSEFANVLGARQTFRSIQYFDIFSYLSEDLLVKADRASMYSSLETRVPYLDHTLVEFVWSLDYKITHQKRLMKTMMRGRLPKVILSRAKKGFPVPFSKWLFDERFFGVIAELFDRSFVEKQGLFNYKYIKYLLNEHLSKRSDQRKKLRTYVMFQAWYKNWYN